MSVRTTVGGTVLVAVGIYALLHYPWQQQPDRGGAPARRMPVRLVATWQHARDVQMTWTANGRSSPPEVTPISPWEKDIEATPGSTVTFTVRPLIGGPGTHTCTIEEPPGHPLPGHGHQVGGGNTPIMCTAVIHS